MKSGTAGAKGGAESEEEICEGAMAGSVHITSDGTRVDKSVCALADVGAMGRGCDPGADGATQQGLWQEQQPRSGWAFAEVTWTDANT